MKKISGKGALYVALAFAAVAAFDGSAFAQYGYDRYYDRGNPQEAHEYGYQNGYHDGYRKGRHEGHENDPGDIDFRALQQATHGYHRWMGPVEEFQDGYRDGYRQGFRRGYHAGSREWRDRDYDDEYRY